MIRLLDKPWSSDLKMNGIFQSETIEPSQKVYLDLVNYCVM